MRAIQCVSIVMAMSLTTVAVAADFDGSVPLSCTVVNAHDCLPTKTSCSLVKPESSIAPIFAIDFAKKEVKSPFRTALLPVTSTSTNANALVVQGADLLLAWSAQINIKTGALTVAIADSKGAYVAFGQCQVAGKK
jgi:hypothetical protein